MPEVQDLATRVAAARKTDIQQLEALEGLVAKAYQLAIGVKGSTYDQSTFKVSSRLIHLLGEAATVVRPQRIKATKLRAEGAEREEGY